MIQLSKFNLTFATLEQAREQVNREFDKVAESLTQAVSLRELGSLQPVQVRAGAVAVTITNAPAGSPATFARYFRIPDGAGGFITWGSLT
ncbi:MAG TPA: hypothetical protein VN903_16740 [Polyangia bacterium]|nr:hypothetical protein [Polyangia bacterium]